MKKLEQFFLQPTSPINLAVFRILIFSIMLFSANTQQLTALLEMSTDMIVPASGINWLIPILPSVQMVPLLVILFKIFCALAVVGLFSRFSALIATLFATYLLGIPQLYGKIFHDQQFLIWFGAILAASPCGDCFSLDSWKKWKDSGFLNSTNTFSSQYTLPIRISWLIFGIIYLFPGLMKIFLGGWEWFFSNHFQKMVYASTTVEITDDSFWGRILSLPLASPILACSTVVFEIGFIFALFNKWTRRIYVGLGIFFHTMVDVLIGYPFYGLRSSYVVFFDFYKLIPKKNPITEAPNIRTKRQLAITALVGALILSINIYYGATNAWGWPFTAYPSFHTIVKKDTRGSKYTILAFDRNGESVSIENDVNNLKWKINFVRWRTRVRENWAKTDDQSKKIAELRRIWNELVRANPNLKKVQKIKLVFTSPEKKTPEVIIDTDVSAL